MKGTTTTTTVEAPVDVGDASDDDNDEVRTTVM